jgi:hypothetical protein
MNQQNKNKCRVKHCREESEIILPDGTGLCEKHWLEHCKKQ